MGEEPARGQTRHCAVHRSYPNPAKQLYFTKTSLKSCKDVGSSSEIAGRQVRDHKAMQWGVCLPNHMGAPEQDPEVGGQAEATWQRRERGQRPHTGCGSLPQVCSHGCAPSNPMTLVKALRHREGGTAEESARTPRSSCSSCLSATPLASPFTEA